MKKSVKHKLKLFGEGILILMAIMIIVAGSLFLYYMKDLPRPENFESQFMQPTRIYDQTGKVLLRTIYGPENRKYVSLDKISPKIKQAIIATEDDEFYHHPGIDLQGMIRAILIDLKLQKPVQGASTITQQLIRSYFLTNRKTVERKTKEIILALELDHRYSKDQILEWYFNQIPFGSNIYGVEVASETFFEKSASKVTLSEAAILSSLVRAPSYYSPYGENIDKLRKRKVYVLNRMYQEGFMTAKELEKAKQEKVEFAELQRPLKAPHFTLEVKKQLFNKYGQAYIQRKGLKVYTTLDYKLQQKAQEMVKEGVENQSVHNVHNGSLVVISPKTGYILSLVGSKDYFASYSLPRDCSLEKNECLFTPQFNVALQGRRQPGSALKPFVYATAFEKGYSPEDTVIDEETNFGEWGGEEYIPQNYDEKFRGEVTLKQGLAQSLNVPSVKVLLNLAGLKDSIQTIKESGIITNIPQVPSIVLGAGEVTLLDITSAYGVFANNGLKITPVFIKKIEDMQGNIIFQSDKNQNKRRIITTKTAQIITDILSDEKLRAPMFGYHSNLYVPNCKAAAKTGTNQDNKDFWTVGYTDDFLVGVWEGNNNQEPMAEKPAVVTAGSIWNNFFSFICSQ